MSRTREDEKIEVVGLAFPPPDAEPDLSARLAVARELHDHYAAYLGAPETFAHMPRLGADARIAALESAWLDWEDRQVNVTGLPQTPADFHDWFVDLGTEHVQADFCRYMSTEATLAEIALFVIAEGMVDGRFDDLVAMAQIGADDTVKLSMAENYWDEMGEGTLEGMHTRLFARTVDFMGDHLTAVGVDSSSLQVAEVFENANLAIMYCVYRSLVPRALGALGLMEYSAPQRFQAMVEGCERLNVPAEVIEYQRVHVHVDADHGTEWIDNVFGPLVAKSPQMLREVAVGVVTRQRVANAYYGRVWQIMRNTRQ